MTARQLIEAEDPKALLKSAPTIPFVVRRYFNNGMKYWVHTSASNYGWTRDIDQATRFSKQEAEEWLKSMNNDNAYTRKWFKPAEAVRPPAIGTGGGPATDLF